MEHENEYQFDRLTVTTNWRSFFDVRYEGRLILEEVGDCRPWPVICGKPWPTDEELRKIAQNAAEDAATRR